MQYKESKNEITSLIASVEESGVAGLFDMSLKQSQTRKGGDRLDLIYPAKTIFLDEQSGLAEVKEGNADFLLERLSRLAPSISGDVSAVDLLKEKRFKEACFTEISLNSSFISNRFFQETMGISDIPVFYGSTAGINFSEVLETTFSAQALINQGLPATVVFDFDGSPSPESNRIFRVSKDILRPDLQERMINFAQGSLIEQRIKAVKTLLANIDGLPEIKLVDTLSIFENLGGRFTLGQLLALGKNAGNDPKLFTNDSLPSSVNTFTKGIRNRELGVKSIHELFNISLAEMIKNGFQPAGFTYYAREAIVGKFEGLACAPLKLTEKANIYKILFSTNSLFNRETGNGISLLPITRFRIQANLASGPVDPIALMVLAQDDPQSFGRLVADFRHDFTVLTPDQAITKGTSDKKLLLEDYFNLGGNNG